MNIFVLYKLWKWIIWSICVGAFINEQIGALKLLLHPYCADKPNMILSSVTAGVKLRSMVLCWSYIDYLANWGENQKERSHTITNRHSKGNNKTMKKKQQSMTTQPHLPYCSLCSMPRLLLPFLSSYSLPEIAQRRSQCDFRLLFVANVKHGCFKDISLRPILVMVYLSDHNSSYDLVYSPSLVASMEHECFDILSRLQA